MSILEEEFQQLKKQVEEMAEEIRRLKQEQRGAIQEEKREHIPAGSAEFRQFMERVLPDKPDVGVAFFGGVERKGGKVVGSYFSGNTFDVILKCSPKRVAKLLSPFSNEQRIRILQLLMESPRTSSELSEATGLEGGQLYFHLKELALVGFVEQPERGKYGLTEKGCMAIRTVSSMAYTLEKGMMPEEIEESFKSTT